MNWGKTVVAPLAVPTDLAGPALRVPRVSVVVRLPSSLSGDARSLPYCHVTLRCARTVTPFDVIIVIDAAYEIYVINMVDE
jgi:hypothetical protein